MIKSIYFIYLIIFYSPKLIHLKDYNQKMEKEERPISPLFKESKRRNSLNVKSFTNLKFYNISPEKNNTKRSSTIRTSRTTHSPNYLKTTENTRNRNQKKSLFLKDDL